MCDIILFIIKLEHCDRGCVLQSGIPHPIKLSLVERLSTVIPFVTTGNIRLNFVFPGCASSEASAVSANPQKFLSLLFDAKD
jgi:hypothetical protein